MDLNKPGFFHFDAELVEGDLPVDKVTYLYKKQLQQLELSPKKCPELGAIENTIGVFTYVLHGKVKAIEYFEALLSKTGRTKVNTLANLIFLFGSDSARAAELTKQLADIQKDDSLKSKLELARAMCERGHFCGCYVLEEVHNSEYSTVAAESLKQGIEKGKASGMSQNEACIWEFYLFKVTKEIFINQVIREVAVEDFGTATRTFLDFYSVADDNLDHYKGLALVEVAVMFTFQRDKIKKDPEFLSICQEDETLREIWEDAPRACDEAMAMDPADYRIPFKASRVYSKLEEFDKAQECITRSLELNRDINLVGMNCQMILYSKRGMKASKGNDHTTALEWYLKAYNYGKEIEKANEYATPATLVEMNYICFNIALDRTKQPWQVKRGREAYLDEAILYGKRALASKTYGQNARVLSGLGECYAFKKNYAEAAKYLGRAADADKEGNTGNAFKTLKYLSEKYHQHRQQEAVSEIASTFVKVWKKHPKEDALNLLVKYGNNYIALKNRLIQKVIEELSMSSDDTAPEVLEEFCRGIVRNLCKAPWLKDACQQYL